MIVSEIMTRKVIKIGPNEKVIRAVVSMNRNNIGSIVVVKENMPIGIITERDILKRIVAKGRDASKTECREIMSKPLITIDFSESLERAVSIMSKKRIKKLIVIKEGKLVGILTATDIIKSGEKLEYAALKELAQFYPVYIPSGEGG